MAKRHELQIWHACSEAKSRHDPFKKILERGDLTMVTWPLIFGAP